MTVRNVAAAIALSLAAAWVHAQTVVRVITFDGGWNLPVWAAQRQGFFETYGITVQLSNTPNSGFLVSSLLDGRSDIALALIDNLVAYQEGQGETKVAENPDLFAFMGTDSGFLSVVAAPLIRSFADLKGKTLSVDAMTTGAAFVLRELVVRNGLKEDDVNFVRAGGTANRYRDLLAGKQDGTLLRTPFELLAEARGFRQLATAESLGPYQGTAAMARRSWASTHQPSIVAFMRGWRAGVDWLYDRGNRDVVEALLIANIRDMTPALAHQSYDLLLADKGGLSRNLDVDAAGLATVLRLRSKFGVPRKELTDPARYFDASYILKAFAAR